MMATIGVTRGLGDHDLKVFSSNIHIKPFLSCFPEVSLAVSPGVPVMARATQQDQIHDMPSVTGASSGSLPLTLASCPVSCQVRVYDLTQYEHCPDDVLVLGTDGLWDVTNDKEVAGVVMEVLMSYEPNDPCR